MIQQICFSIICILVFNKAIRKFYQIYTNIQFGKDEPLEGTSSSRTRNMILFALGQKKMFTRPIAGIFHFFIYVAFLLTQVELIEIFIDGFSGHHRAISNHIGILYPIAINAIEMLSFLALVATFIFLYRRNILKLIRFQKPELKGWPSMDANLILMGEIVLVISIFLMNGADQVLQSLGTDHYPTTGTFYLSSYFGQHILSPLSSDWLIILERMGWWLHIFIVFGFMLYLPYSKHLHIFLAFPNSYYSRLNPRGVMSNMPSIENEVRGMIGLEQKADVAEEEIFGAKDIQQLGWRTLLEAYTCTECGRCTDVCPANLTGKKLSPRKVMMDIRDRTEEVGHLIMAEQHITNGDPKSFDDGKSLFDLITKEEIYACTSCNACVEACPVLINPLNPILQLRRYDILMNSGGPAEWLPMFNSLENNQSVWQVPEARDAWAK